MQAVAHDIMVLKYDFVMTVQSNLQDSRVLVKMSHVSLNGFHFIRYL